MREQDWPLVRACEAGDRKAWETLIRRYERLLMAIPRRCGLSEEDAADVFQTVCMKLVENLSRLRDERHLTGWLITTAKHESWNIHRKRKRLEALVEPEALGSTDATTDLLVSDELLPEEAVQRLEEAQLVREALEDLGERCRLLLQLLYHSDPPLTYAEVAARLNVSTGAIGPTRGRCLVQLKKILDRNGF